MTGPRVVLLGPQRWQPNLAETLRSLPGVDAHAPVAIVSAGWEERELEHEELERHVGVPAVNLEVYHRIEEIYAHNPVFREAMLARHDRLRALQDLYRVRLAHALDAARELLARDGDPELLDPERDAAIEAVRQLDAHHEARIRETHAQFDDEHSTERHPMIAKYRDYLRHQIDPCSALCVAGGNVAILVNRLRVTGLLDLWPPDRPIVGWGAGAMVLARRVVVFHDSPPQGAGNAEVLEVGFDAAPGIVPLPHARERLRLDDANRVRLFARRFGPDVAAALESGTRVDWSGTGWVGVTEARRLDAGGALVDVSAPSAVAGP